MSDHPPRFRVNGRLVDTSLNRVGDHPDVVQIEPKIMQVLAALAARAGEVVTRDELIATVWSGVFVTDDVLHRAIRELRRVFDDDPDRPRVIETIRKRGYRLIAAVEPATSGAAAAAPLALATDWTPGPRAIGLMLAAAMLAGGGLVWLGVARAGGGAAEAGLRVVPLTSDPGNEVMPTLSTDGSTLAYVKRGADGRAHVFVKALGAASSRQVSAGDSSDVDPAWSPDGSSIAFARLSADRSCEIAIADAATGAARTAGPCGSAESTKMSWSPDGRRLAIAAGGGTFASPSHLELLDPATGARVRLTTPPAGHVGDDGPAYSPDGRRIAFTRTISGSIADVFVVDARGGVPRQITFDDADVLGVSWDVDGRHIVFSSDRAGGIGVWRVDADGGAPVLLVGGTARLKHPSVAPGNGTIAYENWQYEINLRDLPTGGGESPRPSVAISPTSEQWNLHPQLSPDGTRVAFQSTRSGDYQIWVADRDGRRATPVTATAGYKSLARWSPDGRRLVFASRVADRTTIVVVDVETRGAQAVATDAGVAVAPSWAHDGRHVYFGSRRSGSWQIWSVDVAGGQPSRVTEDGGYAGQESSDGRWLYFTRIDRPGLWRRSTRDGTETLVYDRLAPDDWPNWSITDRGVALLARPDDGDPVLMLLEPAAERPIELTRLPDFAWDGISVSRDATHVLYAHTDRREANIVALEGRARE